MVSAQEKKIFIRWILTYHTFKLRDSAWLLNYLVGNDLLIERTHFVFDAKKYPFAFLLGMSGATEASFRFYENGTPTTNSDNVFRFVQENNEMEIYIQLAFNDPKILDRYLTIVEDGYDDYVDLSRDEQNESELLLGKLNREFKILLIKKDIDEALDVRDFKKVKELWERLNSSMYNH